MRIAAIVSCLALAPLAACSGERHGAGQPAAVVASQPAPPPAAQVEVRILSAIETRGERSDIALDLETIVAGDQPVAGTTSCSSIFDETSIVVTDPSGHELLRQSHNFTCSPYADGRPVSLAAGGSRTTLHFSVDHTVGVPGATIRLEGNLAGLPGVHVETTPVTLGFVPAPAVAPAPVAPSPPAPHEHLGLIETHAPEWNMGHDGEEAPQPRVVVRPASALGPLEPEVIRRVLLHNLGALQHCYATELARQPGFAGPVSLAFTVDARGESSAVATTAEPALAVTAACLATVVRRLRFPSEDAVTHIEVELLLVAPAAE